MISRAFAQKNIISGKQHFAFALMMSQISSPYCDSDIELDL